MDERSPTDAALERVRSWTNVVTGYFQDLEIVETAWPELQRRMSTSQAAEHRAVIFSDIRLGRGAIHYRLGDYLNNPAARRAHGVTAPAYFRELILGELEKHGVCAWTVVSDEPAVASDLLASIGLPNEVELDVTGGRDEWADLLTLCSSEVCVISNSSFSWWAGYLGQKISGTRVVAPRPWFGDGAEDPPIFPSTWKRCSRELLEVAECE